MLSNRPLLGPGNVIFLMWPLPALLRFGRLFGRPNAEGGHRTRLGRRNKQTATFSGPIAAEDQLQWPSAHFSRSAGQTGATRNLGV